MENQIKTHVTRWCCLYLKTASDLTTQQRTWLVGCSSQFELMWGCKITAVFMWGPKLWPKQVWNCPKTIVKELYGSVQSTLRNIVMRIVKQWKHACEMKPRKWNHEKVLKRSSKNSCPSDDFLWLNMCVKIQLQLLILKALHCFGSNVSSKTAKTCHVTSFLQIYNTCLYSTVAQTDGPYWCISCGHSSGFHLWPRI